MMAVWTFDTSGRSWLSKKNASWFISSGEMKVLRRVRYGWPSIIICALMRGVTIEVGDRVGQPGQVVGRERVLAPVEQRFP